MDETRGNLPRPETRKDGEDGLNLRERKTAGELQLLDPHLAGLYERGLALVRRMDQPGNAYIVAHVGRELSRGVVQCLLRDEGLEVAAEDLEGVSSNEKNRPPIAKALGLEPDDPRVDEWFHIVGQFSCAVHWRFGGPQSFAVREAFERFNSLLYGRVASYFVAEAELDPLLAVETPTREHAKQLRDLQLRLGLRNYFFRELKNSAWVKHLAAEGFFASPPGRQQNADGSWSSQPWPEGRYLVLAAPDEPEAVLEVLNSIPLTNENPFVWDDVAKAGCRLPPNMASRAVPILTKALKTVPTASARIFSESVVDLLVLLAETEQEEAFDPRSLSAPSHNPKRDGGKQSLTLCDMDRLGFSTFRLASLRTSLWTPRGCTRGSRCPKDSQVPAVEGPGCAQAWRRSRARFAMVPNCYRFGGSFKS